MVKVVRTPGIARQLFDANQLAGWEPWAKYTYEERSPKPKKKRDRRLPASSYRNAAVAAEPVKIGRSLVK